MIDPEFEEINSVAFKEAFTQEPVPQSNNFWQKLSEQNN